MSFHEGALSFLSSETSTHPELESLYLDLGNLLQAGKYFELTNALLTFVRAPTTSSATSCALYENFVKSIDRYLDDLHIVTFCVYMHQQVLRELTTSPSNNPVNDQISSSGTGNANPELAKKIQESVTFFENLSARFQSVNKGSQQPWIRTAAQLVCSAEALRLDALAVSALTGNGLDESSKERLLTAMKKCSVGLTGLSGKGIDPFVAARCHLAFLTFYQLNKDLEKYYDSGIQYLTYTNMEYVSDNEKLQLGYNLAIAALVGDNIFDFGKLLEHPSGVLKTLAKNKEYAYLVDFIKDFSSGNYVENFTLPSPWNTNKEAIATLVRKMKIIAVVELAFHRRPDDRTIHFKEIAPAIHVNSIDAVEWVLLHAMEKGMIKGTIDQVRQTVSITWVKPRVLKLDQVEAMRNKLNAWSETVDQTLRDIKDACSQSGGDEFFQ